MHLGLPGMVNVRLIGAVHHVMGTVLVENLEHVKTIKGAIVMRMMVASQLQMKGS